MIGYDDPEYGGDSQAAAAELVGYAMIMAEDRRGCPGTTSSPSLSTPSWTVASFRRTSSVSS